MKKVYEVMRLNGERLGAFSTIEDAVSWINDNEYKVDNVETKCYGAIVNCKFEIGIDNHTSSVEIPFFVRELRIA